MRIRKAYLENPCTSVLGSVKSNFRILVSRGQAQSVAKTAQAVAGETPDIQKSKKVNISQEIFGDNHGMG